MGSTSIPMFWYWPRTTPLLTHVGITRLMHTGPFQRSDQCLLVLLGTDCIPIPRFDHGIVQLLVHVGTRPADACSESDPWVWSWTPWSKPASSSTRPISDPASLVFREHVGQPRSSWSISIRSGCQNPEVQTPWETRSEIWWGRHCVRGNPRDGIGRIGGGQRGDPCSDVPGGGLGWVGSRVGPSQTTSRIQSYSVAREYN
mmetsp:Transcript_28275/g.28640  ORF Transcript_28275/g.28640 Transcript_28275/m.28640 type:complete len:201 (-) Transcript_28275:36-638(-)